MRWSLPHLIAAFVLLVPLLASCGSAEPAPTEAPGEPEHTLAPEEPAEPEPTLAPEQPVATPSLAPAETVPTLPPTPVVPTPSPLPVVEERNVELQWPDSMRVADGEVIRLCFAPSSEGAVIVTPEIAGHQVESMTLPLPVMRPGYKGYVRAHLAAAGLEVTAAGPAEQPLQPGGVNTWYWTISAVRPGTYHPVVNLTTRWESVSGAEAAESLEETIWSRVLTVKAHALLGLSGPQVDVLGLGGSILGTVAGLPFLEKALTRVWRRLRRLRLEGSIQG